MITGSSDWRSLTKGTVPTPYYQAFGQVTDGVMRCTDCARLVTVAQLKRAGKCPKCGTRRVKEVQTLSGWEWVQIWVGLIRFPLRRLFLREFGRG